MNPSDKDRDALTEEYRKASAREAGGPAPATRSAILAEAAAAARRRKPAANDSRYLLRGVAGVAVLGIAVLMWQQMDHRMPGKEVVVAVTPVREESKAEVSSAPMAPPTITPGAKASPPAPAPRAAAEDSARVPARTSATAPEPFPAEVKAESPSPAPATSSANAESRAAAPPFAGGPPGPPPPPPGPPAPPVFGPPAPPAPPAPPPASAAVRNESAIAQSKMSAEQDAETDAVALLRQYFPQQYQSRTPQQLWLVLDAAGTALRSGELTEGQSLADLRLAIERDLGGRLLRPWRIRTLRNARDQPVELAIAQTP